MPGGGNVSDDDWSDQWHSNSKLCSRLSVVPGAGHNFKVILIMAGLDQLEIVAPPWKSIAGSVTWFCFREESVGISSCSLYKRHHHPDPRYPRRLRPLPLLTISSLFSSLFSFQTIVRSALTVKAPEESSSLDVFPLLPHAPYVVRFTVSAVALILIVTIFLYRIHHVLKRYQERGLKVQII